MRLCKQTPCGPCDVIWLGEILGNTPFEYINRAVSILVHARSSRSAEGVVQALLDDDEDWEEDF